MNALGGGEAFDAGVGLVVIVVVDPGRVCGFAFGFAGVGACVGPFSCEGPVEAFDFPVRLGMVGPGVPVFHRACERLVERARPVARAIIRHHRADRDVQALEERVGPPPECCCGLLAFVVKDLRVRHSRVVVNGVVEVPVAA